MALGVEVTGEREGDVMVVSVDGRIDASSTPLLEKKLARLLDSSDHFLFDFSKVSYLSSAGMRLLLSIAKKVQAKEGKIAFFGMSDDVIEIIKMAGFERILRIFSTKKEALKAL